MAQPFVSSQIYSSQSSDKLIRSTYVAKMVRSTTMGPKCPYTVPNCLRAICSCANFLHPAQCLPIIHHPQSFHFAGSPPLKFFVTRISPYYYWMRSLPVQSKQYICNEDCLPLLGMMKSSLMQVWSKQFLVLIGPQNLHGKTIRIRRFLHYEEPMYLDCLISHDAINVTLRVTF